MWTTRTVEGTDVRGAGATPLKRPLHRADTRNMRGMDFESVAAAGETRGTEPVARHEVVSRLRLQVARGAYEPPVDKVVDRLVSVILAGHARTGPGTQR